MIRFFTTHPTAANILMVAFLVLGLVALPSLLRETFPRIEPRTVQISVAHPGATSGEVARSICRPLEEALEGIEKLHEVICVARESLALTQVEMQQGADFEQFVTDLEAATAAIQDFPDQAEAPVIEPLGRVDPVAWVALTAGPDVAPEDLKALAQDIRQRMLRWGGIPRIELEGFSDQQIRIEIPEASARQLGLSLSELSGIITRQNVDAPVGEVMSPEGSTLLRLTAERRTLADYQDLVIASSAAGGTVRLGDIATISDNFSATEVLTTLNGERAAILRIVKTPSDDTLRVMAALRAFLDDEGPRLPPDVALTITGDTSGVLVDRLNMLTANAIAGIVLVFGAMWLFFGFRSAFWITAGLPVSFLGAIAAMAALGYSLNMLTMVGLLIVIGILMDDAIVIGENIASQRAQGLSSVEASVVGVVQVAPGVLASFATTAIVFGSLAFLEGNVGELLRVIPVVMILVLAVSLVEAFLILPAHLGHADGEAATRPRRADLWLDRVRSGLVGPVVGIAVRHRYLALGLTLFLFLLSLAMLAGGLLKFQAFPEIDGDQVEARLELPAGASLEQTQAEMAHVLAALDRVNANLSPRNPGGASLVQDIVVTYSENPDAGGTGPHLATARIDLLPAETRGVTLDELLAAWRDATPQTPGMRRLSLTEPSLGPAGRAIELRLQHDDLAVLEVASEALQAWLLRYDGTVNITDDLTIGRSEMLITLRDDAHALGFDARAVADQLRAGFLGVEADEVRIDGEAYQIDLRLSSFDSDTLGDVEQFTLTSPTGARVPFDVVAQVSPGRAYDSLRRIDGIPTVTVTGEVDPGVGNADEIVRDTLATRIPELMAQFPGLDIRVEGQNAEAATTTASMLQGLMLGLIGVYLVLSFQLRSYVEPIIVMSIIPFALPGVVFGHMALGLDLTLPSMLGFVSLAGIVVNDSILLVNFIKSERAPGVTGIEEAAVQAAMARFRAILLTSVTTIVGILPLLTETSLQAQLLIPLVASIAFGLLATTLLILLVIPATYGILDDLGLVTLAPVPTRRPTSLTPQDIG